MSEPNVDPAAGAPSRQELRSIRAESTRHVYVFAAYGQPTSLIAALVLAATLWIGRDPAQVLHGIGLGSRLVLWSIAMTALVVWQYAFGERFRRSSQEERSHPRWERLLVVELGLAATLWGLLPIFMMPSDPRYELIVVITLVGVANGALPTVSVNNGMFYAWVMPVMLALVAAYGVRGDRLSTTLALLLALDLGYIVKVQRDMVAQFVERVLALMRNDRLIARVQITDAALKQSLVEHELLFDMATVGIAEIRERHIVRTNSQLETMLGYAADALIGESAGVFYPPGVIHPSFGDIAEPLSRGETYECDMQVRRCDGSLLWVQLNCRAIDPAQSVRGVIAIFHDISDRRERETAMQRLAHEDALTGLPNRRMLDDRARRALLRAKRLGAQVAVLLIDLDGFKRINDGHGHDVGDQVLIEIARRLETHVRASDTVSRLGGDEFVVLLDAPVRPEDAALVAGKLVAACAEPIHVRERVLTVGASIGISVAPQDGEDVDALLRRADEAMYCAKQSGRGAWRLYVNGGSMAA